MNIKSLVSASHEIKAFIPFEDIETDADYQIAIDLMNAITDDYDESLSVILDIVAPKISAYEDSLEELQEFNERITKLNPGSAMLKLLMEHHHLQTTDFREEIGVKSVVSMISNGKRDLTAKQIKNLSNRFDISPALFF